MARRPRVFIDGAIHHVYCRTARSLRAFDEPAEADALVELFREIKERDGWTVYAWCVMPTHYHIALSTSSVALSKTMHAVQGRFARAYNRRKDATGAFWQGRFRAQTVARQDYFDQLIFYIHLNPVKAGIVDDASGYRWSGHRELMGRASAPLVDGDDALHLFGGTIGKARQSYLERMETAAGRYWSGVETTKLPWWMGTDDRVLQATHAGPEVDELGRSTVLDVSPVGLEQLIDTACDVLQVDRALLQGSGRVAPLAFARRVIATLGVHRFSLKTKELAVHLGRHADSVSRLAVEGLQRRRRDSRFGKACDEVEAAVSRPRKNPLSTAERVGPALVAQQAPPQEDARPRRSFEVWD